ncbi:MAG: hypothetical protein AMXMBFR48_00320 [Ignavibacteriales bacterium]
MQFSDYSFLAIFWDIFAYPNFKYIKKEGVFLRQIWSPGEIKGGKGQSELITAIPEATDTE